MGSLNLKIKARLKRKKRIRKKIVGTESRLRFNVFRSARHVYVQIIDDIEGRTVVSAASSEKAVVAKPKFESKIALATYVGQIAAERALQKGIKKVIFDRNGFLYHGRIKAVSEGARKAGLDF